jgi:protein tyrosine phosphatase (PTP) superfamily phosphohydrolase (DUF442 family)
MARKKKIDPIHHEVEEVAQKGETVFFRVKRPMTEEEHNLLSDRVRFEAEKSGLNIVLVPYTCDVEFEASDGG